MHITRYLTFCFLPVQTKDKEFFINGSFLPASPSHSPLMCPVQATSWSWCSVLLCWWLGCLLLFCCSSGKWRETTLMVSFHLLSNNSEENILWLCRCRSKNDQNQINQLCRPLQPLTVLCRFDRDGNLSTRRHGGDFEIWLLLYSLLLVYLQLLFSRALVSRL